MNSTEQVYERARLSRDARFDGHFFVAVKTTGVYCRPICPANAPKSKNVCFFPTAAAAAEAGFRPCLRCRPESAPGTPAWSGTSATVRRGLRLIAEGALDDGSVEDLADRLGVTGRHLRRLFTTHLGASPIAVAHTQRLHFAKKLIDETALPMRDIAIASGFGSTRRFNDTFQKTYGRPPRELRRRPGEHWASDAFSVTLTYRKPFDYDALLGFFAARAIPGVEQVGERRYLRSISSGGRHGILDVQDGENALSLRLHGIPTSSLIAIVRRVREMFDLDASIADVRASLAADKYLAALLATNPGVRVPGAWDGFELTVRAILGQQVSVKAATTLAGRIVARYGEAIDVSIEGLERVPNRLFPDARRLARARLENLGIIGSRARTIRSVSRAVVEGRLHFDGGQDTGDFARQLTSIKGIGEWTAQYVAMRALKNPDAFPATDLALLRAFDTKGEARMRPTALARRAECWRPWRAYAALLLWGSAPAAGG
jgi:AraC family transcriptional regulator of adaptative response / DNA-3-methyladenine glycosylase II